MAVVQWYDTLYTLVDISYKGTWLVLCPNISVDLK